MDVVAAVALAAVGNKGVAHGLDADSTAWRPGPWRTARHAASSGGALSASCTCVMIYEVIIKALF